MRQFLLLSIMDTKITLGLAVQVFCVYFRVPPHCSLASGGHCRTWCPYLVSYVFVLEHDANVDLGKGLLASAVRRHRSRRLLSSRQLDTQFSFASERCPKTWPHGEFWLVISKSFLRDLCH